MNHRLVDSLFFRVNSIAEHLKIVNKRIDYIFVNIKMKWINKFIINAMKLLGFTRVAVEETKFVKMIDLNDFLWDTCDTYK